MRTPFAILAGTLMLAACGPTTRVVYVPVPASTPAPAPAQPPARVIPTPAPVSMPPVGVTIVRVDDSRLLVSTNQPAYVAVFEIVPNRGVTLVYPASRAQRQMAMAGSNWLPVAWRSARGLTDDTRDARGRRQRPVAHHVYVLASERPLRLTDNAFDDAALGAMLGARLTSAADPYETMAALSRRFVPPGSDEDWGEDVYTMDVQRPAPTHVAKVYCPDGSVVYVRDELSDRAACPWRGQGRGNAPVPRPDSVVASTGQQVPRPVNPGLGHVFRIPAPPVETPAPRPVTGGDVANGRPENGNGGRDGTDAPPPGRDKPKGNNGNHYGWGNGNGNGGSSGNSGNNGNANNGNAGNGNASNGNANNGNDDKDKSNNGNHYGQEKGNNGNGANGNGSNNGRQGQGQSQAETTVQQQGKPAERPAAPAVPAEVKPEPAPAAAPAARNEPPKQEPRGAGVGRMLGRKADADSAAAKDKKGKPDRE